MTQLQIDSTRFLGKQNGGKFNWIFANSLQHLSVSTAFLGAGMTMAFSVHSAATTVFGKLHNRSSYIGTQSQYGSTS